VPPQRLKDKVKQQPQNRSRIVVEPSDEERAARDVEIQQRGGYLHDTIKIDPFSPSYGRKEFGPRSMTDPLRRA
jgi:hypothetical protein